ncbi:transposase [Noviherbaspirillum sp. 1P10PC]|uniref:transposase n=1 Tax=Noviherbaspirillum sp. 1P10PC TaxID=3132292 RepID=UPI00399FFAF6
MGKRIFCDELQALNQTLPPPPKPRRFSSSSRIPRSHHAALTVILPMLRSSLRWTGLPSEMDYGASANCWPWVRDWQEAGAWERLRSVLVAKLCVADYLGFPRVVVNHDSVISSLGRLKQVYTPLIVRTRGSSIIPPPKTLAHRLPRFQLLPIAMTSPSLRRWWARSCSWWATGLLRFNCASPRNWAKRCCFIKPHVAMEHAAGRKAQYCKYRYCQH